MVSYAFEKLYADLVAPDGTVCIVYLTWTELFGMRRADAGYELYTPDGRRDVVHAIGGCELPDLSQEAWCVRLRVPGGEIELTHRVRHGAWRPEGAVDGLEWSVCSAHADAELRWLGGLASRGCLRGRGYADWVVLRKFTRNLGLERVEWGRVHVGDDLLVFNRIRHGGGRQWTKVLSTRGEQTTQWDALDISERDGSTRIHVPGGGPELRLSGGRTLHEGPALDVERVPSALARLATWVVSPPVHETRWVRQARSRDARGWALHERVTFGGAS